MSGLLLVSIEDERGEFVLIHAVPDADAVRVQEMVTLAVADRALKFKSLPEFARYAERALRTYRVERI